MAGDFCDLFILCVITNIQYSLLSNGLNNQVIPILENIKIILLPRRRKFHKSQRLLRALLQLHDHLLALVLRIIRLFRILSCFLQVIIVLRVHKRIGDSFLNDCVLFNLLENCCVAVSEGGALDLLVHPEISDEFTELVGPLGLYHDGSFPLALGCGRSIDLVCYFFGWQAPLSLLGTFILRYHNF